MKFSFIPFAIKVVLSSIVSEARESPNSIAPKDIAERSNRKILRNEQRIDGSRAARLSKLELAEGRTRLYVQETWLENREVPAAI